MSNDTNNSGYSAFLPVLLLSVSLLTFLTLNITMAVRQRMAAVRLSEQMNVQLRQAQEAEEKLRLMMTDLVQISKTSPRAKEIVKKFQISFTPDASAKPAATPDTKPDTKPEGEPAQTTPKP